MASRKRRSEEDATKRRPPVTPHERETQLISDAMDLAGRQIRDGTASSQVITHYLKLGSSRERLEQERLGYENQLLDAKREALASQQRVEELYSNAIQAMRAYSGNGPPPLDEDEDADLL